MLSLVTMGLACELEVERSWLRDAPEDLGMVDVGDVAVVRIVDPSDFTSGLSYDVLDDVTARAVNERIGEYDFVLVLHSADLAVPWYASFMAFHLPYNRDLPGTGGEPVSREDIATRSVLWMNTLEGWDGYEHSTYVFNHELGHYWLAKAQVRYADPTVLLGRGDQHWSWFMDNGNSPLEGNAFSQNADGTWSADASVPSTFSDLDLYLMGLEPASSVTEIPVLVDWDQASTEVRPDSFPQHFTEFAYTPVDATRTAFSVEDVIAANGPVTAPPLTDIRILPVYVAGPNEPVPTDLEARTEALFAEWAAGWSEATGGRSDVTFGFTEDESPWRLPPRPEGVYAVPLDAR